MEEFIRSYGLWIVLGGIFLAMQWFGGGCGAGHRNDRRDQSRRGEPMGGPSNPEAKATPSSHRGCH